MQIRLTNLSPSIFLQLTWLTVVVFLRGLSPPHTQLLEVVGEVMEDLSFQTSHHLTDVMKDSVLHLLQPLLRQFHRYSIICNKELARVKLFFPFLFQGQIFFVLCCMWLLHCIFFPPEMCILSRMDFYFSWLMVHVCKRWYMLLY